jgi:L-threonylcarbamoyladenylate synthase
MTSRPQITTVISEAVDVLRVGGLVGLPTETVYGLGALALNQTAVRRLYDTKGRPYDHPLIVHVADITAAQSWGIFNEQALELAHAFWPGPLTLLVPRTDKTPDWVTGGRHTVAIRVPFHPVALELLQLLHDGVVAPSANKFGKVSPTTAQHVAQDLGDAVDLILDGGECSIGVESTIVECANDAIQILRPGAISAEQIETVLRQKTQLSTRGSRAPGMLEVHYAPSATVILCVSLDDANAHQRACSDSVETTRIIHHADPNEYAQHLYQDLRQADTDNIAIIFAVLPASFGIGEAVRDRLTKAASR